MLGSWRRYKNIILDNDLYRLVFFVVVVSTAVVAGITVARLQTPTSPLSSWGDVDPEILQDVETVLAWDGVCDLSDPVRRSQIEAGQRVFHTEAVACLVPQDVFEGGWERRSDAEKAALLELLGAYYVLSGDERVLELEVCAINELSRMDAEFDLGRNMRRVNIQPFHYALALPDAVVGGNARRRFFECPLITLEQRLRGSD